MAQAGNRAGHGVRMSGETTYLAAILAGMISFLSPCVLPLVPPYLCYMTGVSLDRLGAPQAAGAIPAERTSLFFPALLFVLGFSTVFVLMGWGASAIGGLLRQYMDVLAMIAGVAIIAMGLNFLGILRVGVFFREARFQAGGAGLAGSYAMGLAFAFGWTPCIGPVLGAILAVAGTSQTAAEGALLLAAYSAGLGIPFLAAALFVTPFMRFLSRFKQHMATVEKVMGGLLVLTGVAFLTGGMQTMSFWLLETFPALGRLG
jgi:cytochrome c-type biogenesis protein